MAGGSNSGPCWCPVFYPTKEEFSKPFCTYVKKILKKHPDVAMFKVVPPEGWAPRRTPFPKLSKVEIATPIKQHVFGTRGAYRCMLIEQKAMTAATFKEAAEDEDHTAPKLGARRGAAAAASGRRSSSARDEADELLERNFWSSVTINPPLYGADTPQSFFDERLAYGWNLRRLDGCLLKRAGVPHIPGVTSPMTYFGMWKSFFSWHVEDADLFSINYLHFGASKVWYCVPPSQRAKFERMAQSLFPELHRACHAFMRHKDILLSPSLLRTYGVEYTQARQGPNEFIVLNAGAYHSGYNLGFNCAEAVNFATDDWLQLARCTTRCQCDALRDGVRISMRLFGLDSDSSEGGSSSEEEGSEEGEEGSDDEGQEEGSEEEGSEEDAGSGSEEEESGGASDEEEGEGSEAAVVGGRRQVLAAAQRRRSGARQPGAAARGTAARPRKRAQPDTSDGGSDCEDEARPRSARRRASAAAAAAATAAAAPARKGARQPGVLPAVVAARSVGGGGIGGGVGSPRMTRTAQAAAAAARTLRRTHATAEARARLSKRRAAGPGGAPKRLRGRTPAEVVAEDLERAAAAAEAIRARAERAARGTSAGGGDNDDGASAEAGATVGDDAGDSDASTAEAVGGSGDSPARVEGDSPLAGEAPVAAVAAVASADDGGGGNALPQQPHPADGGSGDNGGAAAVAASPEFGGGSEPALTPAPLVHTPARVVHSSPQAIVGEEPGGAKFFYMVQALKDAPAQQPGHLVLRGLEEGRDGLFRASSDVWEEAEGALVDVRTQWVDASGSRPGGWRLLTLRSRILDTDLVD